MVSPSQLLGIETEFYAHELASIVVWIGFLQWKHEHGVSDDREPILQKLENIEHADAIMRYREDGNFYEPTWPAADFIIGNPPFLGDKKMRRELDLEPHQSASPGTHQANRRHLHGVGRSSVAAEWRSSTRYITLICSASYSTFTSSGLSTIIRAISRSASATFCFPSISSILTALKSVDDTHFVFAYYSPMGGEPSSTTRQRLAGKICCVCSIPIDYEPTHTRGERYCSRCNPTPHTTYMFFMLNSSCWNCQFLEPDLKTPLQRRLNFSSAEKVRELAERGGAFRDLADRQAFDYGVNMGRGSVYLKLTREQCAVLKRI
jgi:hypothetical protein